jgi:low temperature requirement protein LtrA
MRLAVSRAPERSATVAPLELLFDLVYVFAISQLSATWSHPWISARVPRRW